MSLLLLFVIIVLAFYILERLHLMAILNTLIFVYVSLCLTFIIILMLTPDPVKAALYVHGQLSSLFATVPVEIPEAVNDPILEKLDSLNTTTELVLGQVTNVNSNLDVLDDKLFSMNMNLEIANVYHDTNLAQRQFFAKANLKAMDNLLYAVNNPKYAGLFYSMDKNLHALPNILGEVKSSNLLLQQGNQLQTQGFSDILKSSQGDPKQVENMFNSLVAYYNDKHAKTLETIANYQSSLEADKASMKASYEAEAAKVRAEAAELIQKNYDEAEADKQKAINALLEMKKQENLGLKTIQTPGYNISPSDAKNLQDAASTTANLAVVVSTLARIARFFGRVL